MDMINDRKTSILKKFQEVHPQNLGKTLENNPIDYSQILPR